MKTMFALVATGLLLAGCPDVKSPKAPPNTPEPKASSASPPSPSFAVQPAMAANGLGTA